MVEKSVVVMGLPGSGKTTFLAALWHLIVGREIDVKLNFVTLRAGNAAHLNEIARLWQQARVQERTSVAGDKVVSIAFRVGDEDACTLTFPDMRGEAFRDMWEARECDVDTLQLLKSAGVLFFVHADKINSPGWVVDEAQQCRELGLPYEPGEKVPWKPRLAPTQVQIVDLLQALQMPPLDVGPRRLAIILSAWDKVAVERLSPDKYLARKLPLLAQYLAHGVTPGWQVRIYGVSAQGGDYDDDNSKSDEAESLRAEDVPSKRIQVVLGDAQSHDLTNPLHWLLG